MPVHYLDLEKVTVSPNRQRREFNQLALGELQDSIHRRGLFHPVVVREEAGTFILVAGERRLRAIKDLNSLGMPFIFAGQRVPAGQVPVVPLGELSALDAMEAELEENIRRVDLSWQERATATAALMNLRTGQAEARGLPLPSPLDIAREIVEGAGHNEQSTVRKEVILARHLDNPDVVKAKSLEDAYKIIKRQATRELHNHTAELTGRVLETPQHSVHNARFETWAETAPAGQFDVIIADPPYGMGADEFGDSGGATPGAHTYVDDSVTAHKIAISISQEGFRLARESAHAYVFCDIEFFPHLKAYMAGAGWRVFRTPLIWFKPGAFRAPWPEHGPQRKYETLLYAVKGDRPCLHLAGDVITCAPDTNLGHSAQKPVELYRELLSRSIGKGGRVLDPCCGSGPVFGAAHALGASAVGVELDPASYGISVSRIQSLGEPHA